jgi:PAS domain S-box-containing protein
MCSAEGNRTDRTEEPAGAAGDAAFSALLADSVEDLYENAPCGYLSTLLDGEIAKINTTLLTWLGYQRKDVVGRLRFADLLTVGGKLYHETHYAPLLRMQGAVREIALELVAADGRRLPVLVSSTVKIGTDGQPLLVRTTVFDARDRRAYERERARLQRLATTLQRTLLSNLNTVLLQDHPGDPRFCTVVFGLLVPDHDGLAVTVASGGHPPALAIRADGGVQVLGTPGGQPVGILPDARFSATASRLGPGDAFVLYTDGLTEARNPDGSMLGEDHLVHLAADLARADAGTIVTSLATLLTDLGDGLTDDAAVLAFTVADHHRQSRRTGQSARPASTCALSECGPGDPLRPGRAMSEQPLHKHP